MIFLTVLQKVKLLFNDSWWISKENRKENYD